MLMGYHNPIYRYGAEAFARDAVAAGSMARSSIFHRRRSGAGRAGAPGGARHRSPRHPNQRRGSPPAIVAHASGFLYYVAITGITGTARPTPPMCAPQSRGCAAHAIADRGRVR